MDDEEKVRRLAAIVTIDDLVSNEPVRRWIRDAYHAIYRGPGSQQDNIDRYAKKYLGGQNQSQRRR
jgi:hypothetical protein